MASQIGTAKLNGVEPLGWLTDVLERVVSGRTKAHELERLLPWNWHRPSGSRLPSMPESRDSQAALAAVQQVTRKDASAPMQTDGSGFETAVVSHIQAQHRLPCSTSVCVGALGMAECFLLREESSRCRYSRKLSLAAAVLLILGLPSICNASGDCINKPCDRNGPFIDPPTAVPLQQIEGRLATHSAWIVIEHSPLEF